MCEKIMNKIKATVLSRDANIAIIISRFNYFINHNLLKGALDAFCRVGQIKYEKIKIVWVPGAYEIPLISKILAETKKYDAILALATVIRGETDHFKYISNECCSCISNISLNTNVPIIFGVLTTKDIQQAIDRSGAKMGNKGFECALTALEMINLIKIIRD